MSSELTDLYRRAESSLIILIEESKKPENERRYNLINNAYEDIVYGKIRARTLTEGMGI